MPPFEPEKFFTAVSTTRMRGPRAESRAAGVTYRQASPIRPRLRRARSPRRRIRNASRGSWPATSIARHRPIAGRQLRATLNLSVTRRSPIARSITCAATGRTGSRSSSRLACQSHTARSWHRSVSLISMRSTTSNCRLISHSGRPCHQASPPDRSDRTTPISSSGAMLIDPKNDPHELTNLAHNPKHADVVRELSALIHQYAGGKTEATPGEKKVR